MRIYFLTSQTRLNLKLILQTTHYQNKALGTVDIMKQLKPISGVRIRSFGEEGFILSWFIGKNDIGDFDSSGNRIKLKVMHEGTFTYYLIKDDYIIHPNGEIIEGKLFLKDTVDIPVGIR